MPPPDGASHTDCAARYPLSGYPSPAVALGAVGTDAIFACPALSAEESLARYVPTYAFEFNDEHAPERYLPPAGFPYGAAHESEVQYLFDLENTPFPGVLFSGQQALAAVMRPDWTEFAKSGAPGAAGRVAAILCRRAGHAVAYPAGTAAGDGLRRRAPVRVLGRARGPRRMTRPVVATAGRVS